MASDRLKCNPIVNRPYALLIWGLNPVEKPATLLKMGNLRDNLDCWLADNALMKRCFRTVATISGLVERSHPGKRKTGRQVTFSTDIIYDTLRKYDPGHLLLRIARQESLQGMIDLSRIEDMIARVDGRIDHVRTGRITPFAAPLLLEAGKVPVHGNADEMLIAELERQVAPGEHALA